MSSAVARTVRRVSAAVIAFAIWTAATSDVSAQYFGRNKVQYKDFDFQILKTEHFDIYFYPSAREGIDISARLAERWHARLERIFEHTLNGRQPLVLYASHPDFEQTNAIRPTPSRVSSAKAPAASPNRCAAASSSRSPARSPTPIT
jgi:hypothetical protein